MHNFNKHKFLLFTIFVNVFFNLFSGGGFSTPAESYQQKITNAIKPLALKIEKILQEDFENNNFYKTILIKYLGNDQAKEFLSGKKIRIKDIKKKDFKHLICTKYKNRLIAQIKGIEEFKLIFGEGNNIDKIIIAILKKQAKLFRKNGKRNLEILEHKISNLRVQILNEDYYKNL